MKSGILMFTLLMLTVMLFSCKSETTTNKEKQDDAIQNLEKSLEALKTGNGEVVDFRVLKEALPEKLVGMKRTSHTGQKAGMAGFSISTAEAQYEDGDKRISISISDTGGMGMALSAMAAWSQLEIDSETDDGYERTTMIDGKKAIEKYNRTTKHGEISMISADRFIVTIKGKNIEEEDMRKAINKIEVKG